MTVLLVTVGRASLPYLVWNNTVENSSVVNWITRSFTSNIQSFDFDLIYVVCKIKETSPFEESISVHCGVFDIFWTIPDQIFWQGVPYLYRCLVPSCTLCGCQICHSLITQNPWAVFGPPKPLIRYDYTCGIYKISSYTPRVSVSFTIFHRYSHTWLKV